MRVRPFRAPHHTITQKALVGGGKKVRPGELTLAHGGVLFLDEFAEFKRDTIDALRQPLEEHRVVISRVYGICIFPADVMLVAATNPCKCGYYPDRNRCSCTGYDVKKYQGKFRGPLTDGWISVWQFRKSVLKICKKERSQNLRKQSEKESKRRQPSRRKDIEGSRYGLIPGCRRIRYRNTVFWEKKRKVFWVRHLNSWE